MTGPQSLSLADGESVADLATLVRRAARLDEDGAIRLQAAGGVLAAWVCVLPGAGLLRSGLTLGLRTMALAPGGEPLDVTVPLAGLTDRFARRAATGDSSTTLPVPPTTLAPPWAAQSPPRGGWEPRGGIPSEQLVAAARSGIAEVATGAPEGSGAAAVEALRARVWERPVEGTEVPAGAGLAVHALGFLRPGDTQVAVHRNGPWLRVSTAVGHVVLRT
ncbi:hypothetical protein [uncultured Serinicoccus sp.]|uniref:hypothetical protein n=1 Tax=uncultured Serinicoccus sp. TaxID=735514 RepID=UPI00261895C4|nr:hypothetical protein [uncultured Serinicoccus sp.]